jgi:hypothetical protein
MAGMTTGPNLTVAAIVPATADAPTMARNVPGAMATTTPPTIMTRSPNAGERRAQAPYQGRLLKRGEGPIRSLAW